MVRIWIGEGRGEGFGVRLMIGRERVLVSGWDIVRVFFDRSKNFVVKWGNGE